MNVLEIRDVTLWNIFTYQNNLLNATDGDF
jgi:hypothetical protein